MKDNLERLTCERDKVQSQLQQISDEIARLQRELGNGLDDRQRAEVTLKLRTLDEEFQRLQSSLYQLQPFTS